MHQLSPWDSQDTLFNLAYTSLSFVSRIPSPSLVYMHILSVVELLSLRSSYFKVCEYINFVYYKNDSVEGLKHRKGQVWVMLQQLPTLRDAMDLCTSGYSVIYLRIHVLRSSRASKADVVAADKAGLHG